MAKPSAGLNRPLRPSSSTTHAARSSVGSYSSPSWSAPKVPTTTGISGDLVSKGVAKCLDYGGNDDVTITTADTLCAVLEEGDLGPLHDPEVPAISDASDDSAVDSYVTEVAAPTPTDSTANSEMAPLPERIDVALSELHGASGLSPRSKRLLAALAEAATAEIAPTATDRRLRRAAFWGKVRVVVLAATVSTLLAVDVVLAAYLYARRVNDGYHVMPPT